MNCKLLLTILAALFLLRVPCLLLGQDEVVKKSIVVKGQVFSREHSSKNLIIITAQDLQKMHIQNLAQLFSQITAVNIQRRGPAETSFDISMRGSNFEQVMILVNGMVWNNPQTGHFNGDLPFQIGDIERVEIIRGGSSTTYGGGAFAGLINIILKPHNGIHLSFTSGESSYFDTSLLWGKNLGKMNLSLSADKTTSSGYYRGQEIDQLKLAGGISYQGQDFQAHLLSGFLDKRFGAANFYAPYPSLEGISAFYTTVQGQKKMSNIVLSFKYLYQFHEDDFTLDRHRRELFYSRSKTRLNLIRGSLDYQQSGFKLESGFEWKNESMDSTTMGTHRRNQLSLHAGSGIRLGRVMVDGGLRLNLIQNRISHVTFFSGISHPLTPLLVLKGSVGSSYRLPSFTEMFYNSPANIGNPHLEPETSTNYELSLSYLKPDFHFDISIFYRDQQDLIDWVRRDDSQPWRVVNRAEHDIIGLEVTHELSWSRTRINAGLERLWVVSLQDGWQSKYGFRFADFSIKLNVVHRLLRFMSLAANYHYKQIFRTSEKGHFCHLSLVFDISKIRISLRGENLLNTIIEEIPGLPIPGRWFYVTISYR